MEAFKEILTRRHLWHGVLFLLAGLFMLGSYIPLDEWGGEVSMGWGPPVAVVMIGFGVFLLFGGRELLERDSLAVEYYEAIVMAVGIALVVRTFVIEPFKIPSGSMIPTLLVGDYLFVNKFSYGHRLPFSQTRVFMDEGPKRGDIAVFEYPRDPRKDYIKRIVGLPGDLVVYRNKRLFINGEPVAYQPNGVFTYYNERDQLVESAQFTEMLDDAPHQILVRTFTYSAPVEEVVPPGHYFAMGDNRDNSNDSRFWGFVPAHRLVGKAVALFWSWDSREGMPRLERLGMAVK